MVIIKSLLMSKITHILLSLPTPSENTFAQLDNLFFTFIWGNKPPKFRREIVEANIIEKNKYTLLERVDKLEQRWGMLLEHYEE